jgi:hypothetical protein
MSLVGLLVVVCLLIFIFGNPHVGGRVYPGYPAGWGYWPSGIGLIIGIILVLWLLGGIRLR